MIVFNVGTPGSGKSYDAVLKILSNLRAGRMVCTNIDGMDDPVCQQYVKDYLQMDDYDFGRLFRYLTKDEVMKFWETEEFTELVFQPDEDGIFTEITEKRQKLICPVGSLIVIDEVHKYFNSRDWQATESRKLGDWASTHRHLGYDLILITQSIDKVDKQVRTLTEWTYFFRKVNFLGGMVSKKYIKYSYSGDDHDGKALCKNVGTYSSDVFPCYSSYAASDAKEVGFMTHVNILKHPVFFAIPVVVALCLYMFFTKSSFATGDILGANKIQARNAELAKKTAPFVASPAPSPSPSPVHSPISSARVPLVPLASPVFIPPPDLPKVVGSISDVSGKNRKYLLSTGEIISSKRSLSVGEIYIR